MTKHRLLRWSLLLVVLVAFVVWLEPTRVAWGWLSGEAFYQGRPTNWWAGELSLWEMHEILAMGENRICARFVRYKRNDTAIEKLCKRWFKGDEEARPTPGCLRGDAEAEAVLLELAEHSSEQIRNLARYGLTQLGRSFPQAESTDDAERP